MESNEAKFHRAMEMTYVALAPSGKIATFWDTKFDYYTISKIGKNSCKLRHGVIECAKPTIILPNHVQNVFKGFSDDDIEFAHYISDYAIQKIRVLGYQFKNCLHSEKESFLSIQLLVDKIKNNLNTQRTSTSILITPDDVWSLALTKFTCDVVFQSFDTNIIDFEERGYFLTELERKKQEIDIMFIELECNQDKSSIDRLGKKLQEYDLFHNYEKRFFDLVKSSQ